MTFAENPIRPLRYALIDYVAAIKGTLPCSDCRNIFPSCCMDFDHRPGELKIACVGELVLTGTIQDVEAEISKCDLVCANCHRIRTRDRASERRELAGKELKKGLRTQRDIANELGLSEGYISSLKQAALGIQPRKQLTKEQRDEIRRLRASGKTQREVAQIFGCSPSHVSLIARGLR